MQAQVVFERAIVHHVEHAFVPLLDRVDEFDLGKVLVLHEKPHWYKFWGKKELDFSSLPLKSLLVEVRKLPMYVLSCLQCKYQR